MVVRRGRLFGAWVAPQLKLSGAQAEAYVHGITEALFQPGGQHDLVDKALADLAVSGTALSRPEVTVAFEGFERLARQEVAAEQARD